MSAEALAARWVRYRALRWVGIALFCVATPLPLLALASIVVHGAPWKTLFLSIGAMGLSLGAFGAANDTAVHAIRELGRLGALESAAAAELRVESERRPERLAKLHDSPKAAVILPFVALALILWGTYTLIPLWLAPPATGSVG